VIFSVIHLLRGYQSCIDIKCPIKLRLRQQGLSKIGFDLPIAAELDGIPRNLPDRRSSKPPVDEPVNNPALKAVLPFRVEDPLR